MLKITARQQDWRNLKELHLLVSAGLWGFNTELTKVIGGGSSDDHKLFKPRTSSFYTIILFMRQFASTTEPQKQITNVSYWFFLEEMKIWPLIFQPTLQLGLQASFLKKAYLHTKINSFFACAKRIFLETQLLTDHLKYLSIGICKNALTLAKIGSKHSIYLY